MRSRLRESVWVSGTHVTCPGEPTGRQLVDTTRTASWMKLPGSFALLAGPRSLIPDAPPEEQTTPPKPELHHANCTLAPSQKQELCLAPNSPHTLSNQRFY